MVSLRSILSSLDMLAPPQYTPPGDISGVQVGVSDAEGQERLHVSKVAVCLDVTIPVVLRCAEIGASLLIAHRSPFSRPLTRITGLPRILLQHLLQRKITLFVAHYNWAAVDGGLNDTLAQVLGFDVIGVFEPPVAGSRIPLGRVCQVPKETTVKVLLQHVAKRLDAPFISYVGSLDDEVERLVLVAGDSANSEWLHLARERGYDTYLTGVINRKLAIQARQLKIKLVAPPQHTTETPGMRRLTQILRVEYPQVEFTFIEPTLPYDTYVPPQKQRQPSSNKP